MSDKVKIYPAMPVGWKIDPEIMRSMEWVSRHPIVGALWKIVRGQPTDQVRNEIVYRALPIMKQHDFTHMFMLDSDVEPPPNEYNKGHIIDQLLDCDSDIALGMYPLSVGCISDKVTLEESVQFNESGEVIKAGAGVMLIRREVLEGIESPWFKFLGDRLSDPNRVGEDVYFIRKARAAGFSVKHNPEAICEHYKRMPLRKTYNRFCIDKKAFIEEMGPIDIGGLTIRA